MIIRKSVWTGVLLLVWVPQVVAEESAGCDPWVAKVVSLQGQVEAKRRAASDWQVIKLDTTYCSGDSLRVGENSRAALVLSNDTLLRLDQNSAITLTAISKESPSLLEILTGLVHFISRVPHSLKVNTPYVNAAIEGTEFVVAVNKDSATVTVFEGSVLAQNAAGEVRITHNETAQALAGGAPQKILLAKPRDAVQWALYYPPVFSDPAPLPFVEASDLLYQGRIEAAREKIKKLPPSDDSRLPHDDFLLANRKYKIAASNTLEAIIAVVQNDKDRALQLAQEAVNEMPTMAATYIALSYAQQAQFDLDAATQSATRATTVEPNNALAFARLAELQLSRGYLNAALLSAQRATQLDSKQARAQTILGFAYLTQIHVAEATQVFNTAIELDQADPLPHLGLGLAKIRKNNLAEGRRDIEIAALLDPNNALIRSYLGKAYFEEKRPRLDADQFAMAKELDPNDPTPWFYDAIRKQTENRPVEALEDLQKSIELNGNRAVYRSRLQLDQDEAARSASLAQTYNNLGFEQQAQAEASKSLAYDPSNYSAHRFLSDSYASKPRHEIARSSELLQSQLLQPLSLTPLQPSIIETSLNILSSQGPASATFNEYNPFFSRNGTHFSTTAIVGNNNSVGDELVIAGLYDDFAYSLGQFSYNTDGFRDQSNINHDIANAFLQLRVTSNLDAQYEYRNRRTQQGDLRQDFNPAFIPRDQRSLNEDTNRIGLHYKFSPQSDLLFSYIQNERDTFFYRSPTPAIRTKLYQESDDKQIQYLWRGKHLNLTAGAGISEITGTSQTTINSGVPSNSLPEVNQYNYYIYSFYSFHNMLATLGISYESYESLAPSRDFDETNPKFGLIWSVNQKVKLRFAAYQSLKRALTANQTLEPTQLAGFNQFFDDPNGTKIYAAGIAMDVQPTNNFTYDLEYFRRDLQVPETSGSSIRYNTNNQDQYRAYMNWSLTPSWILNSEYLFEMFSNETKNPTTIETTSIPITLHYYSPTGFYTSLKSTYVKQSTFFTGTTSFMQREDNFTLVDFGIGYHLPNRLGSISLEATNLFDQQFIYQDYYLFSGDSFNFTPRYLPSRGVISKFTLNF